MDRNLKFGLLARAIHGFRRRWRELERAVRRIRGPAIAMVFAALLVTLFVAGLNWREQETALVGHIVRAYGTVRLGTEWRRLETGKGLTVPVRPGEKIQTGEHSATQVLFPGGSRLELEAGSVAQVGKEQGHTVVRMIMGTGFFEFAADSELGRSFAWVKPNGKLSRIPRDSRVVLTLNAANRFEDAVEEQSIEITVVGSEHANARNSEDIELALLANGGSELEGLVPLLVPPIDERLSESEDDSVGPLFVGRKLASLGLGHPKAIYPAQEAVLDLETALKSNFKWKTVRSPLDNPVVAYEIVVRPAFNYEVEDVVRRNQVLRTKKVDPESGTGEVPLDRIGGTGVFLWSVRAVTASGERGPASAARWLEIRFPDMLRAPDLLTPRVE